MVAFVAVCAGLLSAVAFAPVEGLVLAVAAFGFVAVAGVAAGFLPAAFGLVVVAGVAVGFLPAVFLLLNRS